MTREQEQLLSLVRLAIHPEEEMPKALVDCTIEWEKVLDEAKKQSLVGIAYVGAKHWCSSDVAEKSNTPINEVLLIRWHGFAENIKDDNLRVNKRTAQTCYNFAQDGFRTSVMKGQGNAMLYGDCLSLYRASGDVDVWVEGGFQRIYEYVMKVAPTNVINEKEIAFDAYNDVVVEIHYRPYIIKHPLRNKRLQDFFAAHAEACFNNHVKLLTKNQKGTETWSDAVVTTVPFNLIHQLAHIKNHLFNGGIGLRHIMDYYFQLIHAEKSMSQEEKNNIVSVAKSLGLERLACALVWILENKFGLPKACLLWEPNQEDGIFFLEEIFRTGNFGRGKKKGKRYKKGTLSYFLHSQKQNLAVSRFDRTDWFWGSLWRIYHYAWRRLHGFTH